MVKGWENKVRKIFDEMTDAGKILTKVKERLKGRYGENDHIIGMSFDQVLSDYMPELQGVPYYKTELQP